MNENEYNGIHWPVNDHTCACGYDAQKSQHVDVYEHAFMQNHGRTVGTCGNCARGNNWNHVCPLLDGMVVDDHYTCDEHVFAWLEPSAPAHGVADPGGKNCLCGLTFESPGHLRIHILAANRVRRPIHCGTCRRAQRETASHGHDGYIYSDDLHRCILRPRYEENTARLLHVCDAWEPEK